MYRDEKPPSLPKMIFIYRNRCQINKNHPLKAIHFHILILSDLFLGFLNCMYVCVCVCVYVYIYIYIYACI